MIELVAVHPLSIQRVGVSHRELKVPVSDARHGNANHFAYSNACCTSFTLVVRPTACGAVLVEQVTDGESISATACHRAVRNRSFADPRVVAVGREANISRLAMAAGSFTATNSSDG